MMQIPRFQKLDASGNVTGDDATDYVALRTRVYNQDGTSYVLDILRNTLPCGEVSHSEAAKAAARVDVFGLHDWRLPTRTELLALVDDTRYSPAIDPVFECESDWYWTSTPAACSPAVCAWLVGFLSGSGIWSSHNSSGFVRAVRVSQ